MATQNHWEQGIDICKISYTCCISLNFRYLEQYRKLFQRNQQNPQSTDSQKHLRRQRPIQSDKPRTQDGTAGAAYTTEQTDTWRPGVSPFGDDNFTNTNPWNYSTNTGRDYNDRRTDQLKPDDMSTAPEGPEYVEYMHSPKLNQRQMPIIDASQHIGPSHTDINILLLGTAKAGKYTIAKHIAMTGDGKFKRKYEYKGVGAVHQIKFNKYNFVFIDTAGVELDQLHYEKPNANKIRKEIETFFPKGVHLILLVVRKDCWTPEELESLAYIVETLFTEKSRKNIALIHSACENLERDRKDKYIKRFRENDGPAGKLSSLCLSEKTLAVGFPNVEEASVEYRGLHERSIQESTKEIRHLSESVALENPLQISDLFRQKRFSEKLQMFPTVQCIVM